MSTPVNRYGLQPGERLVCGNCGAFLPRDISPETHAEWTCRCGEDWFVAVKRIEPGRRRARRLPLSDDALAQTSKDGAA